MNLPETQLARRVLAKFEEQPPVNVEKLAKHYADFEYRDIPFPIDGLSLDIKLPGKRPRIIVNTRFAKMRQRFTLAHELGHVLIPWHYGSIADDISKGMFVAADNYSLIEQEANRFASELLMPSKWVRHLISEGAALTTTSKKIRESAQVSQIAASLKVVAESLPGRVLLVLDENGGVTYSSRSPGTVARVPKRGVKIKNYKLVYPYCEDIDVDSVGNHQYLWWHLPTSISLENDSDERDWKEILDTLLSDFGIEDSDKTKAKRNINTLASNTSTELRWNTGDFEGIEYSAETIYAALIQNFYSHPVLKKFVAHKYFFTYLKKKARWLANRRY